MPDKPDDYEARARKMVEIGKTLDPDMAAHEEETVKEIAAALPKVDAVFGEPGSMRGPSTWELVKAPFTGRLHGVEVERGLWPWAMILLKVVGAVVAPLFGLVQWVGFWNLSRSGFDARLTEEGVEVFSKRKGLIATYPWSAISQLRRAFDPPIVYWQLVLADAQIVRLHLAQLDPAAFRARGIAVDEERQIRG